MLPRVQHFSWFILIFFVVYRMFLLLSSLTRLRKEPVVVEQVKQVITVSCYRIGQDLNFAFKEPSCAYLRFKFRETALCRHTHFLHCSFAVFSVVDGLGICEIGEMSIHMWKRRSNKKIWRLCINILEILGPRTYCWACANLCGEYLVRGT